MGITKAVILALLVVCLGRLFVKMHRARTKFRRLQAEGIPIMQHSYLLGHLPVIRHFYKDWATDANFIQTFGYYISKHWRRFFPNEDHLPPVIYVDVCPIATPMAFSMEAYVSNQIELGKSLPKSPMQGEFLRPISNGRDLNCMHGEEWRIWRTRFNPGFSKDNIRRWVPAIVEEVESFVEVLCDFSGNGQGEWGPVFQLEKVSGNLAFDATGRIVVNQRFRSLSTQPEPFSVLYRRQLENMEITLNIFKLLWRATPFFKWSTVRRRRMLFKQLRPFIVRSFANAQELPMTILGAAVKEHAQEASQNTGKEDKEITEDFIEQVSCQLMIFFFGGEDAVSIVIPWLFYRLQTNPECLERLREEHNRVLGHDSATGLETITQSPHLLDSLQYSNAVIKETLRLNPATITIREGQSDFSLKIAGSDILWPTQGFDLFDSSITIHRDPANFPRPLEFIPERFTVPEGQELHPKKNIWRGFQLGPRQCIGQEMAIVLLKLVLVSVVRTFDVEMAWDEWDAAHGAGAKEPTRQLVEGERMYTTGKATSHPKDGAPVHVRLRR